MLGPLMQQVGKPAEALAFFRRSLPMRQKLSDENPNVTEFRRAVAGTIYSIGNMQTETGSPKLPWSHIYGRVTHVREASRGRTHRRGGSPRNRQLSRRHGSVVCTDWQTVGGRAGVSTGCRYLRAAFDLNPADVLLDPIWRSTTSSSASCFRSGASGRRPRPNIDGRSRSARIWPSKIPPSPRIGASRQHTVPN